MTCAKSPRWIAQWTDLQFWLTPAHAVPLPSPV
jgi:hypothetical protein